MPFKVQAVLVLALLSHDALAAPQFIIFNADVFTADPARPRAKAVAVENGLFSAVGSNAEVRVVASASQVVGSPRG